MRDPTDIGSEQEAAELRGLKNQTAKEQWQDALKFVMGDRRGRRMVWRLLEEAGVYRSTFDVSAVAMAFKEGARNQGLFLVAEVQDVCPREYDRMKAEQRQDARRAANPGA